MQNELLFLQLNYEAHNNPFEVVIINLIYVTEKYLKHLFKENVSILSFDHKFS